MGASNQSWMLSSALFDHDVGPRVDLNAALAIGAEISSSPGRAEWNHDGSRMASGACRFDPRRPFA